MRNKVSSQKKKSPPAAPLSSPPLREFPASAGAQPPIPSPQSSLPPSQPSIPPPQSSDLLISGRFSSSEASSGSPAKAVAASVLSSKPNVLASPREQSKVTPNPAKSDLKPCCTGTSANAAPPADPVSSVTAKSPDAPWLTAACPRAKAKPKKKVPRSKKSATPPELLLNLPVTSVLLAPSAKGKEIVIGSVLPSPKPALACNVASSSEWIQVKPKSVSKKGISIPASSPTPVQEGLNLFNDLSEKDEQGHSGLLN
ncbi:predicted protein [Arabidopsis lyrata subsp. lyrata]|uniref:Predicted protein n=1 Tax=Arabidopsis lyrata subsp. lyrata TaxID=81972 RepID=D7KHE6_ARALL|nr:predicted protein [Arabidopsis lyrata subsp. lyrata]